MSMTLDMNLAATTPRPTGSDVQKHRGAQGLEYEFIAAAAKFFGMQAALESLEKSNPQLIRMLHHCQNPTPGIIHRAMRLNMAEARNHMRYLIITGDTVRAKNYQDQINLNFNDDGEKPVVDLAYAKIAQGAVAVMNSSAPIPKLTIAKLAELRKITDLKMPKELHETLLGEIVKAPFSDFLWVALYLDAAGLEVSQKFTNALYQKAYANTGVVTDLQHALMIQQRTGKRTDDAVMQDKLYRSFAALLKMDNFLKYLPVIAEVTKPKADAPAAEAEAAAKAAKADVEKFIAVNYNTMPVCGIVALKLAYGIEVSDKELDGIYDALHPLQHAVRKKLLSIKEDKLRDAALRLWHERQVQKMRKDTQDTDAQ